MGKRKKLYLAYLIYVVITNALLYLLFAFAGGNINAFEWQEWIRFIFVFVFTFNTFYNLATLYAEIQKTNPNS